MFNPLALKIDDYIQLSTKEEDPKSLFMCNDVTCFKDTLGAFACRYRLRRTTDGQEIWLEVKKDRALNYQLFYYEVIEEMPYNPSFLAMVGTSTLGYQNPKLRSQSQIIFNRIPKKGEVLMPIKYIVTEDELPENPQDNGYHRDGNGFWYFMTKRSEGAIHHFSNQFTKRTWEYKHNQERLMIEVSDFEAITIYEGREIARRDLKKL